ncbi:ergothioneine biosynthesis protein EgtB [Gilvimarinus sp. SDUM040013]|uniref:Ergothioneine biosynthesis protein EgtB n=1 Tax=Gilvimarinus gilvus TaxID=3058038 RepID=A0ABU4RYQ8_9GAMM|nr:ergothioneine biosynthesis protein EgtB [Gilvimarinus sp. SDUM040013]MDO3386292.1 ergothioneine biosynthesis protein EgtB [Gilvimarinus sp. SDUM040013]MDX6850050.1 ergothioneine biosynthesis protein EgtB [Gilvimarinus sp. SDUM040013]
MLRDSTATDNGQLLRNYQAVRARTLALTKGLSAEDLMLQSMPDASPGKWHLAHTTWFFEEFILKPWAPEYPVFNRQFSYLFNSYYNAVGNRHPRPRRGILSRPDLSQILEYRAHVDQHVGRLLANDTIAEYATLVVTGLHHEMQHQELFLTDIKHALFQNTFAFAQHLHTTPIKHQPLDSKFAEFSETLTTIGASNESFRYDCEAPEHKAYINAFSLRTQPITNAEWLAFIEDRGYRTPGPWLSDGWDHAQTEQWQAPLYWRKHDDQWQEFTLSGWQTLDPNAPVCHISFYEADAFCRWASYRLPTEVEWEHAARTMSPNIEGQLADSGHWQPTSVPVATGLQAMHGSVWEWTASAFAPYPGFRAEQGALGEYNGKFMANQFVLKGGSCATPRAQLRHSYRNFFYPHQRWQFSGVRPATNT